MIKRIQKQMFLLLLLLLLSTAFASTVLASDKPAWNIGYKKLNLPKYRQFDQEFNVQFTQDNKILISFLERKSKNKLADMCTPEKSALFFVVLLLSSENGELIRRVEWPVSESAPWRQTRMYPLPTGGYVGIIDRLDVTAECREMVTHLQMFDQSFNIIHDRVLETFKRGDGLLYHAIIVPLSGKFIILVQREDGRPHPPYERFVEIIDTGTFEIVERFDEPNFRILDIWRDQLLSNGYSNGAHAGRYIEKKIGASEWSDLGLAQGKARYIYNGTIVVTDFVGQLPNAKAFWFIIENGKKGDPVFEGCISKLSWNTPVIACERGEKSLIQLVDFSRRWFIETYDLNVRQVLLATKKYSPDLILGERIVGYAISPDGGSIILMTNKKIELYNVKPQKEKK